jgi:hypothetical protein
MKTPKYLANMLIPLDSIAEKDIKEFVSKLLQVKGVAEVKPHVKEAIAYLKVDNQQLDKNQLQHLILQWTSA